MAIELLAFSDTHLGDLASVLNYQPELDAFSEALAGFVGSKGQPVAVGKVVMVGDIPERCLADTDHLRSATQRFMRALLRVVRPQEVIYLVGNHDHTLWRDFMGSGCVVRHPEHPILINQAVIERSPSATKIANIFFDTESWADHDFRFSITNYLYHHRGASGRSYLFAHGQHWRHDVMSPILSKLLDEFAPSLLGHPVIASDDPAQASDMGDLELRVYRMVDSLWSNDHNDQMSREAMIWWLQCNLSSLSESRAGVDSHTHHLWFDGSLVVHQGDKKAVVPSFRDADGDLNRSAGLLRGCITGPLRKTPELTSLLSDDLTFVYGDTHDGGYGTIDHIIAGKPDARLYNLGAWITHNHTYHPPGYIFGLTDGAEYLVEVKHDLDAVHYAAADTANLLANLGAAEREIVKKLRGI